MPEYTYSVSWRLQRITTEYAYVSVPITDDVTKNDETGVRRIDVEKMVQRALALGQVSNLHWHPEDKQIQMHPVQKAPDPGERSSS